MIKMNKVPTGREKVRQASIWTVGRAPCTVPRDTLPPLPSLCDYSFPLHETELSHRVGLIGGDQLNESWTKSGG